MPNAIKRMKLTKTEIEKLPVPSDRDYRVWDTEAKGLVVRVLPSGSKNYQISFREGRKQRWRSLGSVYAMPLKDARDKANAIRVEIRSGYDRFHEQDKRNSVPTLTVFVDEYFSQHALPKKAARSVQEDRSLWRNHIAKEFGCKRLNDLTAADVRKWHANKSHTPFAANRALSLLSKLMSFAIAQEYIDRNVCSGVERFAEAPRAQTPSDATIRRVLEALKQESDIGAVTMIKLLLFTGARRGEALKATWQEFNLEKEVWTVPVSHLKGGKRNKFDISRPLSKPVVEFMREWQDLSKSADGSLPTGFVFPNTKNPSLPRHCIKAVWDRVRTKAGAPEMRLHDLRHFFASLALAEGASIYEIGAALGHRSNETTLIYARASAAKVAKVSSLVSNALEGVLSEN